MASEEGARSLLVVRVLGQEVGGGVDSPGLLRVRRLRDLIFVEQLAAGDWHLLDPVPVTFFYDANHAAVGNQLARGWFDALQVFERLSRGELLYFLRRKEVRLADFDSLDAESLDILLREQLLLRLRCLVQLR